MALSVCRPVRHPKTGVYLFRKVVPAKLRPFLGKTEVKQSLRTKDPAEARQRHALMAVQVEREWQRLLGRGEVVASIEASCESPAFLSMPLNAEWEGRRELAPDARRELAPDARREDKSTMTACGTKPDRQMTLPELVDGWWKEAHSLGIRKDTYDRHSKTMGELVALLGHSDPSKVRPSDIVAYKDHRLAQINPRNGRTISARTVKDGDLSSLKVVFTWAVANKLIDHNPASGITLKLPKPVRLRTTKGLTDDEAKAILRHALKYQPVPDVLRRGRPEHLTVINAKRWIPWLCAYTGARIGELVQLRKRDVRQENGVWIITITPEAGAVKTNEAREVPLHDHLLELGFTRFVHASPEGHLFLNVPAVTTEERVTGQRRTVKNRVTEFVREVVKDENVQPNHGWRHRFKTVARNLGMDPGVRDAIQGHESASVAENYGDVTIEAKLRAIKLLPRYVL